MSNQERLAREAAEASRRLAEESRDDAHHIAQRHLEQAEYAADLAREQIEAIEENSQRTLAEQRRLASDGWKLQAQAKVDRAWELYRANMHKEASELCEQAISEDPGNIRAYYVGAWSHNSAGNLARARALMGKAIGLLSSEEYRADVSWFWSVLGDLVAGDPHLRGEFSRVLVEASEHWVIQYSKMKVVRKLIGELVEFGMLADAEHLCAVVLRNAGVTSDDEKSGGISSDESDLIWLLDISITSGFSSIVDVLLRSLVECGTLRLVLNTSEVFLKHGRLADLRALLTRLCRESRSLIPRVLWAELVVREGTADKGEVVSEFLRNATVNERETLLREYAQIVEAQVVSDGVIESTRKALADRYRDWEWEIEVIHQTGAQESAALEANRREFASTTRSGLMGCGVALLVFPVLWVTALAVVPRGYATAATFGFLILAMVSGLVTRFAVIEHAAGVYRARNVLDRERVEREKWAKVLRREGNAVIF